VNLLFVFIYIHIEFLEETYKIIISHFFIGMSSLAFYAAPIENNDSSAGYNTIDKKKASKNKTLKKRSANQTEQEHVKAMIDTIHNSSVSEETESDNMGEFKPPPPPESAGGARVEARQNPTQAPQPYEGSDVPVTLEAFNGLESAQAEEYYKKVVPYFSNMSNPSQNQEQDLLIKLDKILHLLEEQQNDRTGHVTEEIILYSFLGIFIIFIIDSFARVGKYVR